MSDLCIIHLVWAPLGPAPLERFLAACRRTPAGRIHRLVIVLNGFTSVDAAPWRALLRETDHHEILLGEPVHDIAAYAIAARQVEAETLCFCNSYSEPLAAGWLDMLASHAGAPGVGLVGASGSWESHRSNLLGGLAPRELARALRRRLGGAPGAAPVEGAEQAARRAAPGERVVRYARELRLAGMHFDRFPSPHVRTNGFLIRRDLFLSLPLGAIHSKRDALRFESGRDGMTRQVEARGLRTLVVGRDGSAFGPADWWRSRGYRSGAQDNLLIADNRTREFASADPARRAHLERITWGTDPASTADVVAARTAEGS